MIFFETFPMIFDENPDIDGLSKWWGVSQHILDPNKKLDDLKKALEKIEELSEYDKNVLKAFTNGSKPPLKFSDCEHRSVLGFIENLQKQHLDQMKMRRKPNRGMTKLGFKQSFNMIPEQMMSSMNVYNMSQTPNR